MCDFSIYHTLETVKFYDWEITNVETDAVFELPLCYIPFEAGAELLRKITIKDKRDVGRFGQLFSFLCQTICGEHVLYDEACETWHNGFPDVYVELTSKTEWYKNGLPIECPDSFPGYPDIRCLVKVESVWNSKRHLQTHPNFKIIKACF